ncbi:MAG: hypothetical protein GAK30_01807 [Paracidovorax wautersii]|uniref:Uncharacterized protein n=1 Tax=Paracidovorax wautersii TaxID=1177982 RepID=A0A7V8FP66_9BURK|nr:MAG: hypothetical protein GAK30_01807 [Paracidovorax wautersii]
MPPALASSIITADERLAIAARLHVLMRRVMGRITDAEWMAGNEEYALAMIALARDHARRFRQPELAVCADELASALSRADAEEPQTLFKRVAYALRQRSGPRPPDA